MKHAVKILLMAALAAASALSLCACGETAPGQPDDEGFSVVAQESLQTDEGHSDADNEPLSRKIGRLAGSWYIDGDTSAAHVDITSNGRFAAYYATGNVEVEGYIRYEDEEIEEGYDPLSVYMFYTDDGDAYMGFVDSGEKFISEFEVGNGGGPRYVRVDRLQNLF